MIWPFRSQGAHVNKLILGCLTGRKARKGIPKPGRDTNEFRAKLLFADGEQWNFAWVDVFHDRRRIQHGLQLAVPSKLCPW